MTAPIVDQLLRSAEPSIRWKVRVRVLGDDPKSRAMRRLRMEIRRSPRVRALLDGHATQRLGTYSKWLGGHWVVQTLADLGYPEGDADLAPLCDGVLSTWLHGNYFKELVVDSRPGMGAPPGVRLINGRYRRCGSQQGGVLLAVVRLGLADDRADQLAERLLHWQWPDGGWNCDTTRDAASSSVHETWLPMRALAAYGRLRGDVAASAAAYRAAEVLLERRQLFHRTTGKPISSDWARLRYPPYWHYDLLNGLKGMAELGLLDDDRCRDGLDLLESKRLPDGGWPAQTRWYRGSGERRSTYDHVDWGGVDKHRTNEWVTADALGVLAAAGRL